MHILSYEENLIPPVPQNFINKNAIKIGLW